MDPKGTTGSKVILGFLLFCLHARVRASDASRADKEPELDVPDSESSLCFIEAGFLKHKTSYRARAKQRLPVVADAFGLTGVPWAGAWLRAREVLGLNATESGFLMPTVYGDIDHPVFGQSRATTDEITLLIRECVKSSFWDA